MDNLAHWLGEQLDEDEQIARVAGGKYESGHRWWEDGRFGNDGTVGDERGSVVVYRTGVGRQHSAHIVRHDPARVLREIDAKRRIVGLHGVVHREIGWLKDGQEEHDEIPVCSLCVPRHSHYRHREDVPEGPCLTVRLLALPYADRPGYREDWAPVS